MISKYDPQNKCIKSIGHGNDVGLTKKIYDGLITHSKNFCEVVGWQELKENIATKDDKEDLLSLYCKTKKLMKQQLFTLTKRQHIY